MAGPQAKAFFSYSHFDDKHARGKLSALRKRLEDEVRAQLGTPFKIYQDTIHIAWGADWEKRLLSSINESIFFIPVITPSYFTSAPCREELAAFLQREQKVLYEELILPLYWTKMNAQSGRLEKIIHSRQLFEFIGLRHRPSADPEMDTRIEILAERLIQRLNEFKDHQRQIAKLKASILDPKKHAQVPRRFTATGKTESLPMTITPWLVVQAGTRYHPQASMTAPNWNVKATVGGEGFGINNNVDFSIHVIATSKSANSEFANYLKDQAVVKKWNGLPQLPAGTNILATTLVRRNDLASS